MKSEKRSKIDIRELFIVIWVLFSAFSYILVYIIPKIREVLSR